MGTAMTATDKTLHSANALACIAGCLTAADATALGGVGMGLIMSVREVLRRGKTEDQPLATRTRQLLDAELAKAHLTPTNLAAVHYAIDNATLTADQIIELKRDPNAIAAEMAKALSNTSADALLHDTFCTIVANVLRDTLADPATADELGSAFQTAMIESQARQETLLTALNTKIDRLVAEKENVAREFHIKEGMLIGLARQYASTASDFESALAGLQLALETAAKEQERDALPSNLGEAVDSVVAQVKALNDADKLEEADGILETEMNRLDAEIEEKKAAQARIIDKAISQAIYTADATALADRTLRRIQLDAPSAEDQFHRLRAEGLERYDQGYRLGVPFALKAAIGIFHRCANIAPTPYLKAGAFNNVAIALEIQGSRTEGPAGADFLSQAVTAYRDALNVYTRADHPVHWAATQNNLGGALRTQGSRTEGPAGADLLSQAVIAFRDALRVRTLNDHPVDWAMTQNNLGAALSDQATRADGPEGADLLSQAVTAFRDALKVYTRADYPVDWAMTQNNLGIALKNQSYRTKGPAGADLLSQAVTAYRDALKVYTRSDHPVQWAMTQTNIAITLLDSAKHESTADPRPDLDAALAAVTLALEVFDPVHTSFNHGTATRIRDRIQAALDALP